MQIKNKSIKTFNGSISKVGLVVSRFNEKITSELLVNALNALYTNNVKESSIKILSVPGAMEIPFALQKLAKSKKYDFLVALGCVIKGDTPHFDYVCKTAQEGVLRVSLDFGIPIGFGIMTVNTLKQAQARFHIGGEAAMAGLELSQL